MQRTILAIYTSFILIACLADDSEASTAAFCGQIVAVENCPTNHKECLRQFTVKIDYFDYISWGKFGRHSKPGETITRQVKSQGTVAILNGRLTNARTLAAAMAVGQRGYFYEDTWHDLYTTGDFQWGEVVKHDADKKQIQLRVHTTHKDHHLETNPPKLATIAYDKDTSFFIENEASAASEALAPGNWIQIHQPRGQMLLARTEDAGFDSSELLPQAEGKRGYANDLTAPAILKGFQTKRPDGVIDISVKLDARRTLRGKTEDVSLECKSVTFVLDGKLAPVNVAVKAGRRAVLGYYRSEKTPHKVFVESHSDAISGVVSAYNAKDNLLTLIVSEDDGKTTPRKIAIAEDAQFQLNGRPSTASEALEAVGQIVLLPQRGRTIVAFPPQGP